ncbi:hypothetical protein IF188_06390 [Microbacterium sp. NEAU-LLC]|uniref:Uncharacterized protein n=1 Tax=Microbacterium helvum TaxID=2773713 RepID=A0ABR8NLL3_9MICO|nr:hypothetical protein [Microbacterium helvum]MBD3941327.1 hypothetical protein [Microbacterium helvum]
MNWAEDRVARALQAIDPATTALDEGRSPRSQLVLEDIIHGRRRAEARPARGHSRMLLWRPIAAVFIFAVVVVIAVPLTTASAIALTPPALALSNPSDLTLEKLVDRSVAELSSGRVTEPAREFQSLGWYLDATVTEDGSTAVISPQITRGTWEEDLSGRIVIVAGRPYLATDSPVDGALPDGGVPPGTVLSDMSFVAGEYQPLVAVAPGESVEEMRSFLRGYGLPEKYNAGDIMLAVGGAFGEWTLSDQQHASILRLLADSAGAEVLGTGTDRAGRQVWGVRGRPSQTDGASSQLMLVSADTGRIVGLETILTRAVEEPPLEAGAVISYTMWDTDEGNVDQ